MDIHGMIKDLKGKVARGETKAADMDTLNDIEKYITELEKKTEMLVDPAILESFEEMIPAGVVIQQANIYIGPRNTPQVSASEK